MPNAPEITPLNVPVLLALTAMVVFCCRVTVPLTVAFSMRSAPKLPAVSPTSRVQDQIVHVGASCEINLPSTTHRNRVCRVRPESPGDCARTRTSLTVTVPVVPPRVFAAVSENCPWLVAAAVTVPLMSLLKVMLRTVPSLAMTPEIVVSAVAVERKVKAPQKPGYRPRSCSLQLP